MAKNREAMHLRMSGDQPCTISVSTATIACAHPCTMHRGPLTICRQQRPVMARRCGWRSRRSASLCSVTWCFMFKFSITTPFETFWQTVHCDTEAQARILGRQLAARSYRYGWQFNDKSLQEIPHANHQD